MPERVAARFGGGLWRVQLKDKTLKGHYEQIEQHIYRVPGKYLPPEALPGLGRDGAVEKGPTPVATAVTVAGASPSPSVEAAMSIQILNMIERSNAMMQQQQQAQANIQQMYAAMFEKFAKPGPSLVEQLAPFIPLITEWFKSRGAEKSPMEIAKEIAALMKEQGGRQSDIKDITASIKEIISLRETVADATGGGATGDPIVDSVPRLVEAIIEQQQIQKAERLGGGARRPAPATLPAPTRNGASSPMPSAEAIPMWKRILLTEKKRFLMFAMGGHDPEFCADTALEFMPPEISGVVLEFVQDENHLELAYQTIPELRQFPKWTEAFFGHLKESLLEDGNEDEDDPPEGFGAPPEDEP